MTTHTRYRRLVAVAAGAVLASTALAAATVAPAAAGVTKHKHDLSIYKVEKYVKLGGVGTETVDYPSAEPTVSCDGGDIALDGMWIIRSVDKPSNTGTTPDPDEDPEIPSDSTSGGLYNDARDVYVVWSKPSTTDQAEWKFKFDNRAYGDAQLSIYVVCIDGYTQGPDRHQVSVTGAFSATGHTVANPDLWSQRTLWDSSGTPAGTCGSKKYFVAPGFDVSSSGSDHRLVASYATHNGLSWAWEFAADDFYDVDFYGKCIDRQVLANATGTAHRHTLAMNHLPNKDTRTSGQFGSIARGGDWRDVSYACDQSHPLYHGYKAAVGMFWIGHGWEHNWFLGMEPRPKIRSFRFVDVHGTDSADVRYGALCINTRTSNPN